MECEFPIINDNIIDLNDHLPDVHMHIVAWQERAKAMFKSRTVNFFQSSRLVRHFFFFFFTKGTEPVDPISY